MKYLSVAEARNLPGLRLVLTAGVPGPWGEAAKAVFTARNVAYIPVEQTAMAPNETLVEWTGQRNAPIACLDDDRLCGVAIAGRPVARALDDGYTLEVLRVCTDGTPNACSKLYGAMRRAAREMGYRKVITYTLAEESGTSLRAAGWSVDGTTRGDSWDRPNRPRDDRHPIGPKTRWAA